MTADMYAYHLPIPLDTTHSFHCHVTTTNHHIDHFYYYYYCCYYYDYRWFLAVDFQLFLLLPFLAVIVYYSRVAGLTTMFLISLATFIYSGIMAVKQGWKSDPFSGFGYIKYMDFYYDNFFAHAGKWVMRAVEYEYVCFVFEGKGKVNLTEIASSFLRSHSFSS